MVCLPSSFLVAQELGIYNIYSNYNPMLTARRSSSLLCLVVLLTLLIYSSEQACHATCLLCDLDNSANNCTSCDGALFRNQAVSPSACICDIGYIDAADTSLSPTCISGSCSYTCSGLCRSTASACTACNGGVYRTLSGTTCPCDIGYFDNGVQLCVACGTKCKSCTAVNTCTDCYNTQYRSLSGSSCNCLSGYYDDGTDTCAACSYKCATCTTSAANCVTCAGGVTRLTAATCACATKYYDDGSSASCQACHYSCATCSTGLTCDTCNSATKHRAYSSATQLCACMNRYFDAGTSTQLCSSCHATCLTCSAGALTNCLSCNSASHRVFNPSTNKCDCDVGYYQTAVTTELCASCHVTCATCTGALSTNCATCNSALYRTLSSTSCPCNAGYYNNVNNICTACHSSCATCTTSTTCATCPTSAGTTVNATTGFCECVTTKYWDSVSSSCVACGSKCVTCSITGTNCTSCDGTTNKRILSGNNCLCKTGYYDNNVALCATCPYSCMTCDSTGCLTCNATAKRTKSGTACLCEGGYYDNGSTQLCAACNIKCLTCVTSATNCQTCDGSTKFRILSGTTCNCMTGYFDPGTGSSVCSKCSNKCTTCTTTFANCGTCAGTLSTRGAAPGCLCNAKFYDDGVSADCVACHYSCKTCSSGSTCLTCDSTKFRFISSTTGRCACNVRYYDDGSAQLCAACHATCLTCTAAANTNCLTCNTTAQRTFNSGTGKCDCISKYYETAPTTELCSACDPTCLTCSGATSTSCLTCSSSEKRVFDGTNKCNCMPTFYLDASFVCQPCHSSCATCSASSPCLTCPYATQTINAVTGVCECSSVTAWDSGTLACVACHYSCATCFLATTNCTTCNLATNFRSKVGTACPCLDGYYDNSVAICVACNYKCLTCDVSGCLTCNSASHRAISGVTCPCNNGYYDDGSHSICVNCQYSCKTCTVAATCTGCEPLLFRVMDAASNLCICDIKFYQDPASLTCQPCLYHCATCSVGDRCLTCESATNHRVFNASTTLCQCADRFYDDGANQLCLACLSDCLTCPDYSGCTTCDLATDHRELNPATTRCTCITRYFDDTSVVPPVCTPCHYTCVTCVDASTCATCNDNAYRVKNVATNQCECKPGYYDDGTNQLCVICHYSCATCVSGTTCATCDSGTLRTLATLCVCPPLTYYDDGSNKYCLSCQYSCNTCTDTMSCVTCDPTTNFRTPDTITPYCKCLDGYYDDGYSNQLCLLCPYQCKTCSNASVCLTCDTGVNKRYSPADLCKCLDGFYDDGASHALCATCQYTCKTCVLGTQCATCNVLKFREFDSTTRLCSCLGGYYDTGASVQLCQPCSYTCLTCATASTHCLTCNSTFYRTINPTAHTCPCNQYYYDDLINPLCLSCHYSCMTCSNSNTCDSCDPAKHREADPNTDLCKCSIRYYDDGNNNQICNPCHGTCLECTNATQCTACDTAALRLINSTANYAGVVSPFCVCNYKYYGQTNLQAICLACHYSCGECSGPNVNNCLYCSADAHRILNSTSKKCKCRAGFFDNGAIETCLACHAWCATCTDPTTTTCSSCTPNYFLKLDVTTCFDVCPNYFFGQTSTMTCVACSSHCITCTSATNCSACDPGFPLYKAKCLAACPAQSTFLDTPNNKCIDCPTGCLTCNSLIYCTSCLANYYLDTMIHLCFDCNQYCLGCTGPAQNQCIDCAYPLYLKNNQCFNISCPYGQYIDSHQGCLDCKNLFVHSLTCNISVATLCQKQYKVKSGVCEYCTNVNGYAITSTGDCSEICGDGLLIQYQCDDGNNLDGDGCSSNCLAEEGWHCTTNVNGTSVCTIDGVVKMTLNKVFKYGGQNKIKLFLTLSLSIRLNSRFFLLSFQGLSNSNSITWEFSQSQTNLKAVQFLIYYTQNIDNKQFQLSYDTTRRRLLQAINLTFSDTFTVSSYPPANYYTEEEVNSYNGIKNIIYIGSIVLLCLSALNFIFARKMYIHLFTAACIPAQIFILYGLVPENYTDWIKWSLVGMDKLSFIGGFKVGIDADLATTQHFGYSIQVTKNMGITCCVMLALWILYGLVSFCKRYLCHLSRHVMKISMYLRYLIVTVQFCLLPHMAYSAINALYNSSLTSQTSSINVCLAIFINVYLIGLITALFLLSKSLTPNEIMIQSEEAIEVSLEQNLSVEDQRPRSKQLNSTKHLFFLNGDKDRDDMSINREEKETQKEFQSSRSQLAIMDRPKSKRVFDSSKQKGDKEEKKSSQNEQDMVRQYDGVGYYYNHLETYKKVEEGYLSEWLIYDYAQLYATGGYRENLPPKKSLEGGLLEPEVAQPYKSNQLTLQKYKNTKFYLPLTILKIYLFSLVSSVVQSQPFILFLILLAISLAYFLYLLLIRPFRFKFSNFRVIASEICFICMSGLMAYYMYVASKGAGYSQTVQKAMMAIIAITILISDLFLVFESFGAWRMEIWNKLEPCLVALRLRGARKVMEYKKSRPKFKLIQKAPQMKKEEEKEEEMDAFFARMLKKESLEKQYRRQRMIQNPKVVLS